MNKYKVRIIIEIIISILIVILLGVIMFNIIKPIDKSNPKIKDMKDTINELTEKLINSSTKEEITDLTGIEEIESSMLMTGPDSYTGEKPSNKLITNYKLDDYITLQDKLQSNLESKIKNNFNYKVEDPKKENDHNIYSVSINSYYYLVYIQDLKEIQKQIINSIEESNTIEEIEVNNFKAKIIAMKILDSKLDDYINSNEYCTALVYEYKDDNEKTIKSIKSYLSLLQGINYQNEKIETFSTNRGIRITNYINEAKLNKTVKENIIEL